MAASTRGRVVSIQLCPQHGAPMEPKEAVRALLAHGLEGDVHGKGEPDRPNQVLLVDTATLERLGLRPGDLREQLTVDFPLLHRLPKGTLLQVGQVVLEISRPCTPCLRIGRRLGFADPEGFRRSLVGQRGMLTAVVSVEGEGWIRIGDPVRLLDPRD